MEKDTPPGAAARRLDEETEEEISVLEVEVEEMANEEDLGRRFGKLLEKEKKRVTVSFVSEIEDIRRGYERVIGGLRLEVATLKGSLKENRKCFRKIAGARNEEETEGRNEDRIAEKVVRILRERENEDRVNREKESEREEKGKGGKEKGIKEAVVIESRDKSKETTKNKNKGKKKKKAVVQETERSEARSYSEVVEKGTNGKAAASKEVPTVEVAKEGREGGTFQEVRSKKEKGNKKEEKRKESWRSKEPTKTFVVEVGKGGKDSTKKELWEEMVRKVRAPRVTGVAVLARGDLRVIPGDADTLGALRDLEREGKLKVREVGQNWPKVLVYDVETTMEAGDIGKAVRNQNESTGLEEGREEEDFKPLFRKGPKGGESTWWVCEVNPKVYSRIVNRRIFLGMSSCKVVEYVDVYQCKGCLGFGHMEAKCLRKRVICSHCAKEGHRITECGAKDRAPKCYNCGESKEAGHRDCRVRTSVTRATMVRTDYGSK